MRMLESITKRRARALPALAMILALGAAALAAGCGPPPGTDAAPGTASYVQHVPADQLDTWHGVHYDGVMLDIRTPGEWDGDLGHVTGAVNFPLNDFESRIGELDTYKSRAVLLYDRFGSGTPRAGQILVTRGFRDVSVLDGGLKAYRDWEKSKGIPLPEPGAR